MGLFGNLFHNKKRAESVILINIETESVTGAYARFVENETPALLYTSHVSVETRTGEQLERAILRALEILGNNLIKDGAPILMNATGSGGSETIFVSIDTPWQETTIHMENFERERPFVFTKNMVSNALEKTSIIPPEKFLADESIVGAILNGYETHNPYGKKTHRASVVVLTSFIDTKFFESIITALRSIFHTENISAISGRSLRYQAIQIVFPHERESIIIDVTEPSTSIAIIRKNLFSTLVEVPNSDTKNQSLIRTITNEFTKLAKIHSLPRTIFLLAQESKISSLRQMLISTNFDSFWFSNNPPKIVPVLAGHISGLVRQTIASPPDLQLLLMALHYQHSAFGER
ncbi:MAG: hypothetical protein V1711_00355 [bacterium]